MKQLITLTTLFFCVLSQAQSEKNRFVFFLTDVQTSDQALALDNQIRLHEEVKISRTCKNLDQALIILKDGFYLDEHTVKNWILQAGIEGVSLRTRDAQTTKN